MKRQTFFVIKKEIHTNIERIWDLNHIYSEWDTKVSAFTDFWGVRRITKNCRANCSRV